MERIVHEQFPTEIEHVWSRCGTGQVATDPMGVEETDFFISLKPRSQWRPEIHSQDELVERIEQELRVIPGLLQTEGYARSVISAGKPRLGPDALDRLVTSRIERQRILTRDDPPMS